MPSTQFAFDGCTEFECTTAICARRAAKCIARLIAIFPVLLYASEYGRPPGSATPGDQTLGTPAWHGSSKGMVSLNAGFPNGDPGQKPWGFQPGKGGADSVTGTYLGTASPVSFEFDRTPDAATEGDLLFGDLLFPADAANGDHTDFADHIYYRAVTPTPAGRSMPTINSGGVVNAASFASTIAPGSWVSILGTGFAANARPWNSSDFQNGAAPTQLDGTSVLINGQPALVGYISPTQVNVQAPDDTAAGPIQVTVSVDGQAGWAAPAQMESFSPALFLWQGQFAAAQHADYTHVGKPGLLPGVNTTPALQGETIILYGTGFGPSEPAV